MDAQCSKTAGLVANESADRAAENARYVNVEKEPTLRVPESLGSILAESFPVVLQKDGEHRLGLSHGMADNPHRFVLEVGPAALRVGKRTTRPKSEWSDVLDQADEQVPGQETLPLEWEEDAGEEEEAERRRIREWSTQSRRNMIRTFAMLDWWPLVEAGLPEMVTLTYPGEWERVAPDGRAVKRQLEAFKSRWTRRWGSPPVGVWKLEFQARGAPHFHLYVARPGSVPEWEFREWVSRAWFEAVGPGDERHLRAGTGVDRQFVGRACDVRRLAAYFGKHNSKWSNKSEQNEVPDGWEDVGRFWGVWGLKPDVERVELNRADYHQVCRVLRRLQRAARKGRKIKARGGEAGLWTLAGDGRKIGVQLARWLRDGAG